MNRRTFLASASGVLPYARQAPPRPNVIFILADDLGWGDLSCYGNRRIQTPALDRLAAQGALFTQFYAAGPVCSPSRCGFLTGHFPARHRIHGHFATPEQNEKRGMPNFLDPATPTLPAALKNAGYATAHFGKWHLGRGPGAPLPDAYGFDTHWSVNSNDTRQDDLAEGFRAKSSRLIVDSAIRFVEENRSRPFYAQLWTLVPHAPLAPAAEQMAPLERFQPGPHVPHKSAAQIYYASLLDLDAQIGRLAARLDELGLAERTLILFSSDNGPEDIHINNAGHSAIGSPGPFRGRKRSLYEGGVRVPLIARWPGHLPAGKVNNRAVLGGVDFFPSLAGLCGASAPPAAQLDGEDRGAALLGDEGARGKPLMWEWRFNIAGYAVNRSPMLAIRDGDWKLLLNPDRSRVELYDIPRDPMELSNVADRNGGVVRRLSERVLSWQKTLPAGPIEPSAGRNDYPWPGQAR
jgi:N-acetylgalactosamine-6-sulfatase